MRNLPRNSELSQGLGSEQAGEPAANSVRRLPETHPDQVFFHFDFLRSLQMHRRLATRIFLTAVVLSVGYMAARWNSYKAESQVYVQPSPHHVIENGPSQQWPYDANTYESYIQQQVHDVTRPDVLAEAVKRLPGWRGNSESEQAAADRLGSAIEVTRVGLAYEVSITATARSAAQAAQMANAVAGSYIDRATRELRAGDPQRIELLSEERGRILKELGADRSEEEDLSRKLGVAAVGGSTPDPIDDQITQTRAELVKARTAHDEAAAKLTSLADGNTSSGALNAAADELVAADPGLVSMKTALNKRRSDLISQMANLTPNHPQYKQDADELAKINSELDGMSKELRAKAAGQIEQRLKSDLERTASVEAQLNGQIAQLTGAAGTAAPRLQRSTELAADMQRLRNRFAVVDEQYRNLTMENNAPGAVYLTSAAQPPLHAARGKVLRNVFILLLAGLVFAVAAALIAHNLDPRVYIAIDVERVLGFPPMAQVPDLEEVGSGVADEYLLRVAAALEHAHQQGLLSSCIFTGVDAGAGATTVSSRVSSMLEAMGRDTVLVDAAGTPSPQAPDAAPHAGTDLVRAPRGTRSTALLQQMHQEIDEDTVVVTDTAPLLVSGETEYLARFVDAAIVVVESGVTTKTQLCEVAKTLRRLEVSSVGFVLNRIALTNASPAFRHSVRAVEMHLRSQSRVFDHSPRMAEAPAAAQAHTPPAASERPGSAVLEPLKAAAVTDGPHRPAPVPSEGRPAVPVSRHAPSAEPQVEIGPMPVQPLDETQETTPVAEHRRLPEYPRSAAKVSIPPVAGSRDVSPKEEPVSTSVSAAPASADEGQQGETEVDPSPRRSEEPSYPKSNALRAKALSPVSRPLPRRERGHSSPAEPKSVSWPPQSPARPATAEMRRDIRSGLEAAPVEPAPDVKPQPAAKPALRRDAPRSRFAEFDEPIASNEPARDKFPAAIVPAQNAPRPAPESGVSDAPLVPAAPSVSEDIPFRAASRLGGLRNLMTSLGVSNLHMGMEQRKALPEPAGDTSPLMERTAYAQPDAMDPLVAGPESAQPVEVVARPEIIPPRVHEHSERDIEPVRAVKSPRRSRWDLMDEIETLPAHRGQYRKR